MILSYHPCFEGDRNILCAGRDPDDTDLAAIQMAEAVILPQGCRQSLFEMARLHARHVFPDYSARFRYPGKIGQLRLFHETATWHPASRAYRSVREFSRETGESSHLPAGFRFPAVFKFDWGGEGDTVFFLQNSSDLRRIFAKARAFEAGGQTGFILQQYIPSRQRVLRVVVIGKAYFSYWRIQTDPGPVTISLSSGARMDPAADPTLRKKGIQAVRDFCRKTGINLAGFDLIYPEKPPDSPPCFLEINYYFGRRGIGGSERFYALLTWQIRKWIKTLQASMNP